MRRSLVNTFKRYFNKKPGKVEPSDCYLNIFKDKKDPPPLKDKDCPLWLFELALPT